MKNFADVVRLPLPIKRNIDLSSLIRYVTLFMQGTATQKNVEIVLHNCDDASTIEADQVQMEQIFVNIIKNAMEACEEEGIVKITLAQDKLKISNNGKPIKPEVAVLLFDPFYSTKTNGQGIGLTLTKEILSNHSFSFSLQTDASGWTNFIIQTASKPMN